MELSRIRTVPECERNRAGTVQEKTGLLKWDKVKKIMQELYKEEEEEE